MNHIYSILTLLIFSFGLYGCSGGGNDGSTENPPPPTVTLSSNVIAVNPGQTAELTWTSENADTITVTPVVGSVEASGSTTITPTETQTYTITATNDQGSTTESLVIDVIEELGIRIETSTQQGQAPLSVMFTPILSAQNVVNRIYWDFEGNGGRVDSGISDDIGFDRLGNELNGGCCADYNVNGRSQSFTFDTPGTYNPRLLVIDGEGNHKIVTTQIIVTESDNSPDQNPNLTLSLDEVITSFSLSSQALNPDAGEQIQINASLNREAEIQVEIVSSDGSTQKVLEPFTSKAEGVHTYTWDGKGTNNLTLPPGAYFAVARVRIEDLISTLDLRYESLSSDNIKAGEIFYPHTEDRSCTSSLRLSECGTLVVPEEPPRPFADSPQIFTWTTPFAGYFTAQISIFTTDTQVKTFYSRRPYANRGEHQVVWNGENNKGIILDAIPGNNRGYVLAIFGETLGDNGIVLDHDIKVTDLKANPSYFFPNSNPTQISFSASKQPQSILFIVASAESGKEVVRVYPSFTTSDSTISFEWDGKTSQGELLSPGPYAITVIATDEYGYRSTPLTAMLRINY